MEDDSNDNPCYSTIGRILAIGYITGLREAVYGKPRLPYREAEKEFPRREPN